MSTEPRSPSAADGPRATGEGRNEFTDLLEQVRAGSAAAAQELYDKYHEPVLFVIRHHLSQPLRRICDSIDIAQEVWKSVFRSVEMGEHFASPEAFVAFLRSVSYNKTLLRIRQNITAQKRSLAREEPLERHAEEVLNRASGEDDPSARATDADEWAHLMKGLSERDRTVLAALRQGARLADFAAHLKVSEKTLRRFVERIRIVLAYQQRRSTQERSP
jgi:hypothetical protein